MARPSRVELFFQLPLGLIGYLAMNVNFFVRKFKPVNSSLYHNRIVFKRQTDRPTDRLTDRQADIVVYREVTLPKIAD